MIKKNALITGITGQDGAWLAKFLIKKGYKVHGMIRRSSSINTKRIDDIFQELFTKNKNLYLYYGDLTDTSSIQNIIIKSKPDEIYNLGAQSHVKVSYETPEYTTDVNGMGTLRILESIRNLNLGKKVKFYQASSSEMFGSTKPPQSEKSLFAPQSPYAASKVFAHNLTKIYRDAYGVFACNGILFNHESPVRGETFVTRKITRGTSRICLGLQDKIYLGNLDAKRDWGHAKDYVRMMWMILQAEQPEDWVIATGESTTVRDFVCMAFRYLGVELKFIGKGVDEKGVVVSCSNNKYQIDVGKEVVAVDPNYFRPTEVDLLIGDASKANKKLGWVPEYNLQELVSEMMDSDVKLMKKEQFLKESGYTIKNYYE